MKGIVENTDSDQIIIPKNWTEVMKEFYTCVMTDPNTQNLMTTGINFDLMITEVIGMDPFVGFANYFKMPVVMISTLRTNPFVSTWTRTPVPPSYIPNVMLHLPKEMNFFQRVKNTLMQHLATIMIGSMQFWAERIAYNELFPDPKPSFYQARKEAVSLVLMNSHISLDGAQPLMTNIIEVAGMQVTTDPEPLPADLQAFIDGSNGLGIVYFCLGSNMEASMMHEEKRAAIVKVLSELKENVILKWDHPESIERAPKGKFFASPWLPQSDILANPNISVFITHGGLMGTTETIYHGVPTVVIPFFADQQQNAQYQESLGIGVRLSYTNLTELSFRWAVNELLNNSKYRNTVKDLSRKFNDRPMQPLETAKWWIEYVLRHKGARFLRSPALKLNCIQYENLDVYGFIALIIYLVFYAISKAVKFVYRKFCGGGSRRKLKQT